MGAAFKKYVLSKEGGGTSKSYKNIQMEQAGHSRGMYVYDFLKSHFHIGSCYFCFFTSLVGKRKLYDSANLFLSKCYTLIVI